MENGFGKWYVKAIGLLLTQIKTPPFGGVLHKRFRHELLSFLFRYAHKNLSTLDPGSLVRRPRKGATHIAAPGTKVNTRRMSGVYFCAPSRARTLDRLLKRELLYQLS